MHPGKAARGWQRGGEWCQGLTDIFTLNYWSGLAFRSIFLRDANIDTNAPLGEKSTPSLVWIAIVGFE